MKLCTKCGETKSVAEFSRNAASTDGFQHHCKACNAVFHAAYYATHRETILAAHAVYNSTHKDETRARGAAHYASNLEALRTRHATYDATHRQEKNARGAVHYAAHREEKAAWGVLYRAAHPEERRMARRRRRAAQLNAPGTHVTADISALYDIQDGECFWCGTTLDDGYHVDHLYPLSKGGSDGPENLALTCPTCNMHKSAKDPDLFLEEVLTSRSHAYV